MYIIIEPEVAGGLGTETRMDNSIHPPEIFELHYEFDGWLGSDIIESFPCYVVTEKLKKGIEDTKLSGVIFKDLKVTKSDNFIELHPKVVLPKFYWMQVSGSVAVDDFGISKDFLLVVSIKAFELLKKYNTNGLDYEDYNV